MSGITRRRFGKLIAAGAALALLDGCAPQQPPPASPTAGSGGAASSTPTVGGTVLSTATPGPKPRPMVYNASDGKFYVRYYRPFNPPDPATWTLTVDGLVASPRKVTYAEIQALPLVSQTSRMKCVECWSAPAKWGGFRYDALASLVQPDPKARWVHYRCADDYYESLSIEELRMDRVLFVHSMNGQPLPDEYGAPLRMIVPFKYGYKGPKAITRITFAEGQLKGYWPAMGGYSVNGNIQEGWDHPLDLPDTRRIDGDEIRYSDGIEANG